MIDLSELNELMEEKMRYFAGINIGDYHWEDEVEGETRQKAYNRAAHKFNEENGTDFAIGFLMTQVSLKALDSRKKPLVIPNGQS